MPEDRSEWLVVYMKIIEKKRKIEDTSAFADINQHQLSAVSTAAVHHWGVGGERGWIVN